jgi:hypothetical protein
MNGSCSDWPIATNRGVLPCDPLLARLLPVGTTCAFAVYAKLNRIYMLEVMRDAKADQKRRDAMAIAAAPYL